MFNKSMMITFGMLSATAAHAQGTVDMTGSANATTPAPSGGAVAVPGMAPGGGPWQKGTLGISLPITLISNLSSVVSLTAEHVPTINGLYFLDEKTAIDVTAGILVHKFRYYDNSMPPVAHDTTNFGFAVGAGYRMYKHSEKIHTYLEPDVVLAWANTSDTSALDLSGLFVFGLEAMFTDWSSFSGSVGGGVTANGKFNDIKVATQANLAVNLYWK